MTPGLDAPPTGRLRPLPRPVAPVGNELRSSFVRRVALANRLNAEEFRAYVAADDRKRAAIPLDRLAILSGQPEPRLRRALDDALLQLVLVELQRGDGPEPVEID